MNLEKIKALAQRAVHEATPVEEARSCALIAMRQIVEGGFIAFDSTRSGWRSMGRDEGREGLLRTLARSQQLRIQSLESELRLARLQIESLRGALDRATPARVESPRAEQPAAQPVRISARYGGTCCTCGEPYDAGECVWWVRGRGSAHDDCGWTTTDGCIR